MSKIIPDEAAGSTGPDDAALRRRAEIGAGLRTRVASGTIINALYLVSVNGLTIVQGILMAGLLGAGEYGLWGLLAISFGTLFALGAIGLEDKYIQQDHADQQAAFEIAFTLQSIVIAAFTIAGFIMIPLFAALYDEPQILLPGLLLSAAMPLLALQTPSWVFYRRMDFLRQRVLESLRPVVTFAVTVPLALAGVGFWSLVIGTLAGSVAASVMSVLWSPYKMRFRYERGALREYTSFSWPLLVGSTSGVLAYQIPITLAARTLGPAAVGAITLASQISQYAKRVDDIVTHALYPAICAVKDQRDLLFESFSKSNRLAVLWGFPAGVAAAVFAPTAVPMILGENWNLAVLLIQVLGISAAIDQIGFNWTAFARARGETRILMVASLFMLVAMVAVSVPLLLSDGLTGVAAGIAAGTVATLVVRLWYLGRLFPAASMARHVAWSVVPTLPAVAVVVGSRIVIGGDATGLRLVAEIAVYGVIVAAVSWATNRTLLREAVGYLRQRARRSEAQSEPATRLA